MSGLSVPYSSTPGKKDVCSDNMSGVSVSYSGLLEKTDEVCQVCRECQCMDFSLNIIPNARKVYGFYLPPDIILQKIEEIV